MRFITRAGTQGSIFTVRQSWVQAAIAPALGGFLNGIGAVKVVTLETATPLLKQLIQAQSRTSKVEVISHKSSSGTLSFLSQALKAEDWKKLIK